MKKIIADFIKNRPFSMACRIRFYERMTHLLDSGVAPTDAVKGMKRELQRRGSNKDDLRLVMKISDVTEPGGSLVSALKDIIPATELVIISSGFDRQRAQDGFRDAMNNLLNLSNMKKEVKKKAQYPVMMLFAALGVFLGGGSVLEMFTDFIPFEEWDVIAQNYHLAAQFFFNNMLFFVLFAIIVYYAIRYMVIAVPSYPVLFEAYRKYRKYAELFPPWSIYKYTEAFVFLSSFSKLVRNEVGPRSALEFLKEHSSPYLRFHMEDMLEEIEYGSNPAEAIASTGLIDNESAMTLRIVASTGGFSESVERISIQYVDALESSVSKATQAFTALCTLVLVVFLGWFLVAQYLITN